jgi:arylesterase/paraoxonase
VTLISVAKKIGIVGVIVLVGAAAIGVEFLRREGQFRTIHPHFSGVCRSIAMEGSAEDIRIDHGTGLAYLSYLDRRAVLNGDSVNGTIMLVDLAAETPHLRAALTSEPPDFRPVGISLYTPRYGTRKLFAVSRPANGPQRVEIFEQTTSGLFAPVKTVTHPLMTSVNAILAVGPRQFYVLNDSGATTKLERVEEVTLRRALSKLLFFDGQAMRVTATHLKTPTGLAGSYDGRTVYVSDTLGEQLHVFARNSTTGGLRRTETIPLDSAPDNITLDENGNLWIAAHPKLLALMRAVRNPSSVSPTQVFRFAPIGKEPERLSEVYLNGGEQLSAGSVAAVHGDHMLIGSLTEAKLLDCQLQGSARNRAEPRLIVEPD